MSNREPQRPIHHHSHHSDNSCVPCSYTYCPGSFSLLFRRFSAAIYFNSPLHPLGFPHVGRFHSTLGATTGWLRGRGSCLILSSLAAAPQESQRRSVHGSLARLQHSSSAISWAGHAQTMAACQLAFWRTPPA